MKLLIAMLFLTSFAQAELIVTKTVSWTPSTSVDVASHLLYVVKNGDTMNYDTEHVIMPAGTNSYTLPGDFAELFQAAGAGQFIFGVAAQDQVGNISNITKTNPVTIDMQAPLSPTAIVVN